MDNYISKNYFKVKIRYYADKKLLDRSRGGNLPAQHRERAALYNDFFWKFVEKVTGKTNLEFHDIYMFGATECAHEEMEQTHGIVIKLFEDGYYTYYIPNNHLEIIEWVKLNVKSPYKVLKRAHTLSYHSSTVNYHRSDSKERTERFKQMILISESTRKILIEKVNKIMFPKNRND